MRRLAVAVLFGIAFLLACDRETGVATTSVAPARPGTHESGRLVRRLENDVGSLNPVLYMTDYERYVLSYVNDPLIDLDRELKPIPGTAARWEVADGGRSYTIHVDPRATFSDGTTVRASDVLFTVNKIIDAQSLQFSSWFDALDRGQSKVIDDKTVRFVFREPRAAQLLSFNIAVLPAHVYQNGNFKNDYNNTVVGDGPYKLVSREPGKTILLERRNDYWRDKPSIPSILFRVISNDAVAWMAMKHGDIDEMRLKADVWAVEKDRPVVREKINFIDSYLLQYNCIAWNIQDPVLSDPATRRALAMAYDRDSIIRGLYRGQARPVTGPFTPDQWAYDPNVKGVPYDPNGAKALLQQRGWRDSDGDGILDRSGKKLTIEMLIPAGSAVALPQAQAYQEMLKRIGVNLDIRPLDGAAMFNSITRGTFQSAFMAWSNDPDSDPFALFHSSQIPPNGLNVVRYRSPEADHLIDQARREFDPAKRQELLHRLHAVIARDQPYLFTVQVGTKWALNKRVKNAQVSKGFGLFFWSPGPRAWTLD